MTSPKCELAVSEQSSDLGISRSTQALMKKGFVVYRMLQGTFVGSVLNKGDGELPALGSNENFCIHQAVSLASPLHIACHQTGCRRMPEAF